MNNMNGNEPTNGIDLVDIAKRLGQYFIENITAIAIVVVIIIGALVYQEIMKIEQANDITENGIGASMNDGARTIVVETFDNMNDTNDTTNDTNSASLDEMLKTGFCKSHLGKPTELETECGKLSKNSCTATSCCVWASMNSVESCVSGNKDGPIFKNGTPDSPKTLDYYYFENKCIGNCPTTAK